jgi:uncharacterized protein YrrD
MTLSGDVARGLAAPRLVLIPATSLTDLPVVSIPEGEALAKIKDVVYSPDEGRITGFTLNKLGGLLAGPLKETLTVEAVHAIGRAAVMVGFGALAEGAGAGSVDVERHRNVLGNAVLTDTGQRLGEVTDLIVAVGVLGTEEAGMTPGDVVGYQLAGDPALQGREGAALFVPLPQTLAVSGTALLVPAAVEPFVRDDLTGFGGAVEQFRAQLRVTGATPGGAA